MMKACSKCGEIKSAEGFYRNKNKRDGLQSQCKICFRQYEQQTRQQYNQSENGKQARRKRNNIRRTRKTQAGGSYSAAEWYNLCKFYDFHCLGCNKKLPFDKISPDHIKPVGQSGPSFIWNIQPLCGDCNRIKGNKEIDYRRTLPDWINRNGPIWMQGSLF